MDHTCDWQGCERNREAGMLYCAEHLGAEIDRWLADSGYPGQPYSEQRMVAAIMRTLTELADKADVIAVAGDNRYLNGVYVPSCAEVMHAMRDNIRALERQMALAG